MKTVLTIVFCVCMAAASHAATLYVDARNGNDTSGDGSTGAPYASMAKIFTVVQGGDTVLLQPGFYGDVEFDGNNGVGSDSTGWITYLADPATCTPRPVTWYEDSLARPDTVTPGTDGKVTFSNVKIDYYSSDLNTTDKTGTPDGHYIVLEGVNVVNGNITLVSYVSYVVVRDCNVFGKWSDYSTKVTGTSINLYRAYSLGSNYRHILVEGCYGTRCGAGAMLLGNFTDVTVRNCHFHHFCGSGLRMNGVMDSVLLEGNHVHNQVGLADYVKSRHAVTAVDGTEPDRILTIAGSANYWDRATVIDATDGTEVLVAVESFDPDSGTLVLAEALPFDIVPGDSVWLWDDTHGSGLAVRADNFIFRNNRVHGCGSSRGLYFYDRSYHDVVIENNLFYSTHNYTVDFRGALDNGCRVVHNTFAGTRHSNYYTNGDADMAYGHAMIGASPDDSADAKTIVVANNVFVGYASVGADAVVKNNIVFAGSGFEDDTDGDNSGNLVYYGGEAAGSEPHPFDQDAGFFVGGDGFDDGFLERHQKNFNAYFALAEGSDAVGFADPAYATDVDMTGTDRDGAPDAGCYEYAVSSVANRTPDRIAGAVRAFPNPMRSSVAITVPAGVTAVRIYDAVGRLVRTVPCGSDGREISWDGNDMRGRAAASGVYQYVAAGDGVSFSGRIMVVE